MFVAFMIIVFRSLWEVTEKQFSFIYLKTNWDKTNCEVQRLSRVDSSVEKCFEGFVNSSFHHLHTNPHLINLIPLINISICLKVSVLAWQRRHFCTSIRELNPKSDKISFHSRLGRFKKRHGIVNEDKKKSYWKPIRRVARFKYFNGKTFWENKYQISINW